MLLSEDVILTLTHQACDLPSVTRLLESIVEMCFDVKDWDSLGEYVITLSKRRGQLKQV